jgi:hypothetical protein
MIQIRQQGREKAASVTSVGPTHQTKFRKGTDTLCVCDLADLPFCMTPDGSVARIYTTKGVKGQRTVTISWGEEAKSFKYVL